MTPLRRCDILFVPHKTNQFPELLASAVSEMTTRLERLSKCPYVTARLKGLPLRKPYGIPSHGKVFPLKYEDEGEC